jgi:hypothetical protein
MREIQRTTILNTANVPWKTMMEKYRAFIVGNNITTAAKLYA